MRDRNSQRGSVTAEFALGLPSLVVIVLLLISLAMHGAAQVALEEAARAAARELARGEPAAQAEQAAQYSAGSNVTVSIGSEGEYTTVALSQPVQILGLINLQTELTSEAKARAESLPSPGDAQ